jgi:hypothetical protein
MMTEVSLGKDEQSLQKVEVLLIESGYGSKVYVDLSFLTAKSMIIL